MPESSSETSPVVVAVPVPKQRRFSWALGVVAVVALVLGSVVSTRVASLLGWGASSESTNTQVVRSIELKQDVILVSLSVEAIATKKDDFRIGDWKIPGTEETVLMSYGFDAKLGIDGSKVTIEQTGESAYTVTVPAFQFLAYDNFNFETVVDDGGVLSFVTPDIDQDEMRNALINDEVKAKHVADNAHLLQLQCEAFYNNIVHSIDPNIVLTFVYTDLPAEAA